MIKIMIAAILLLHVPQEDAGKTVFLKKGNCWTCHGPRAQGTGMAPNLTDNIWLNIDGSAAQIAALVKRGVPQPKRYPMPMPAMGGAQLEPAEITAVARYVAALSKTPARARAEAEPSDSMANSGAHMCMRCQAMHRGRMCGMRGDTAADSTRAKQ